MSYATIEDMVTRFGVEKMAQLSGGGPDCDPVPIQAALDDATEIINSYAASRYIVPLTPVPAPVRRWCADIAAYYLYVVGAGAPDDVRKVYEDALKGLADMQKGAVVFQADGLPTVEKTAGGSVAIAGPGRVFTGNTLQGF